MIESAEIAHHHNENDLSLCSTYTNETQTQNKPTVLSDHRQINHTEQKRTSQHGKNLQQESTCIERAE